MTRLLRAALAGLVLAALLAGVPLILALTVGNPLQGWDGLRAGDLSAAVLLDLLAVVGWISWASFAQRVVAEVLALAAGRSRPHLPALVPGTQYLAHTLVTAVFLVLPSTGAILHPSAHASPTAVTLHLTPTAADTTLLHPANLPGTATHPKRQAATHEAAMSRAAVQGPAMHRAHGEPSDASQSSPISSEFASGAGAGLVAGISLRELARLRRRQWRHRRPGQAVAPTPTALVPAEKALARRGSNSASATDRAQVLAAHATTEDQAMPPARGQAPWDTFCDAAGAPLPQFTLPQAGTAPLAPTAPGTSSIPERPRPGPAGASAPATLGLSVLSQTVTQVLATSATTARDVAVLAPQVENRMRHLVTATDPGLDEDLAAWHDPATHRPRLSVLGPLLVRAGGELPATGARVAWHTEVLTYLAAHPGGVSPDQFGTALWPDDPDILAKPKVRLAIHRVRGWLGTNPRTGQDHLPRTPPGAEVTLYRVEDLLTDADLFRRLRLRGVTHGPQGIHDLETALALVTGPPFDPTHRRRDGYSWLLDTPIDAECTAMIIDVAHVVATHHLSTGRPDLAANAARVSLSAGSRDDIPLLDLVAACDAQGHHGEARHWIQQILTTHDTDIEEDLPPRTAEILHRRQWHRVS